jgi:hypothetical protein
MEKAPGIDDRMEAAKQRSTDFGDRAWATKQQVQVGLYQRLPVWCIRPNGTLLALNLLSVWLWDITGDAGRLPSEEQISNRNIFNVFSDNFSRIAEPDEQSVEASFHRTTAAIAKVLRQQYPGSPIKSAVDAYARQMREAPTLQRIYERTEGDISEKWTSLLRIRPPGAAESTGLLEFEVQVEAICEDSELLGYCAQYKPHDEHTSALVRNRAEALVRRYGPEKYVLPVPDPEVYPVLDLDPLWTITHENDTKRDLLRELLGESAVGRNLLDLLFAEDIRLRRLLEAHNVWDDSAYRAVRYFIQLTNDFRHERHRLHEPYRQTLSRLRQLSGFEEMLQKAEREEAPVEVPTDFSMPFQAAPFRFPTSEGALLAFTSMVQPTPQGEYRLTLLPEDEETRRAIVLIHFLSSQHPRGPRARPDIKGLMDQEMREWEKWRSLPGYATIASSMTAWRLQEPQLHKGRAVPSLDVDLVSGYGFFNLAAERSEADPLRASHAEEVSKSQHQAITDRDSARGSRHKVDERHADEQLAELLAAMDRGLAEIGPAASPRDKLSDYIDGAMHVLYGIVYIFRRLGSLVAGHSRASESDFELAVNESALARAEARATKRVQRRMERLGIDSIIKHYEDTWSRSGR